MTAFERRDCRHENPSPSLCSTPALRLAGCRFPPEVIVLAVRWSLRLGLSYRDVQELLAGRGVEVDHVSIDQWVQRFTPLLPRLPVRAGIALATAGRGRRPT